VLSACGEQVAATGGSPIEPPPPPPPADWAYFGATEGLSRDVRDVSADEGGNVYVAGGDALYAKKRGDARFLRFDAATGGLTKNCNDAALMMVDAPAAPFRLCPVISVAGAAPGKAFVGLEGFGQAADGGANWALHTGGVDVVRFDAEKGTLARERHVWIASPPHVICGTSGEEWATTCDEKDKWWTWGRRLVRRIDRIVVNHDRSSPLYGDAWVGGNHGTFSAILANAASRGWNDPTAGWGTEWDEARDVWEHLHPSIKGLYDELLVGEGRALSIDPRDGTPWGSNGIRTARVGGYGADLSDPAWWMGPWIDDDYLDLWPDSGDPWSGPTNDEVTSMSHCADGTLWIGSRTHGLARIGPGGGISTEELPDPAANGAGVSALACDPSDGSLWIGLEQGGILRRSGGAHERIAPAGAPPFARQRVAAIQIDRWASPRVVLFAFGARRDAGGAILAGGGVAAYDGE
jgi:hypothetical protein